MQKAGVALKRGVSSRLSTPIPQTGGKSPAFLDKSLKGKKLRRLSCMGILDEMDKLSCSMITNSSSKRVKLSHKFLDHIDTVKFASPPRKLRSAMKKREHESSKTKSHKTVVAKYKDSEQSVITKEEEEAVEALFALAQTFTDTCLNKGSEVTPKEAEKTNRKMSKKKCPVHVYICRYIKDLQTTESEQLGIVKRSKQSGCVNAIYGTNPYPQWSTDILSNQQQYSGCYQNWQNQRHETVDLLSGSSLEKIGSKTLQVQQQCISRSLLATNKGKLQFSDCDKKGGLFLVDSSPLMLELTL